MVDAMREVARLNSDLTVEERNLLSVAYKNVIGSRRASWRIISSIEQKAEQKDPEKLPVIKKFREQIELELGDVCKDIIRVLDLNLLQNVSNEEARVFYLKM